MVRSLVGALLPVGDGRRPVGLAGVAADAAGTGPSEVVVAPPHGLTLVAVGYPDDAAEYAAAGRADPQPRGPVTGGRSTRG